MLLLSSNNTHLRRLYTILYATLYTTCKDNKSDYRRYVQTIEDMCIYCILCLTAVYSSHDMVSLAIIVVVVHNVIETISFVY